MQVGEEEVTVKLKAKVYLNCTPVSSVSTAETQRARFGGGRGRENEKRRKWPDTRITFAHRVVTKGGTGKVLPADKLPHIALGHQWARVC